MTEQGNQETDGELLARLGTDGHLWGTEFGARFAGQAIVLDAADDADPRAVNAGDLTGWFANAIEAGRSAGQATQEAPSSILTLLDGTVDALVEALPAATLPELLALIAAESGKSKPRKTAIAGLVEALTREEGFELAHGVQVRIVDVADHADLVAERDALAAAIDGAKDDIAAARELLPRKALPVGPLDKALSGEAMAELVGGPLRIVFSDGENEIVAVDPVTVGPDDWVRRGSGFMLRKHLTVRGPVFGAAAYRIAGFGLIDADGDQVGWCELPNVLPVPGGQEVQFRDSILFG